MATANVEEATTPRTATPNADVYWTIADVVRNTRLSRRTIYRLIDAGHLRRHYPRPRCPRFVPSEVFAMRDRVAQLQFGSA